MSRSTPRVAARVDLTPSAEFRVVLATYLWTASAVPAALLVESELLGVYLAQQDRHPRTYANVPEDVLPMLSTYSPSTSARNRRAWPLRIPAAGQPVTGLSGDTAKGPAIN